MNLEQEDWRDQLNNDTNAVILDVRTEEEVANGYIPEAINIDIYKHNLNSNYRNAQPYIDYLTKLL